MRSLLLLAAFAAATPGSLHTQQPITATNWRRHPAITAVRSMTLTVENAVAHRSVSEQTDSADCDGGRIHVVAHLFTDSTGRVRKYVVKGGSDDSAGDATYYYHLRGTLRFIFAHTNAVNGTQREDRVYFDSTGTQLYKNSRLLHGPGYFGGFGEPIRDPAHDFQVLCGAGN